MPKTLPSSRKSTNWENIVQKIYSLPKVKLFQYPTPLESCERLSSYLGGPKILIKRDDLTGLAFGGNKTRMLEFAFGDVLMKGHKSIVCYATTQSNFCRQTAAAAAKLGLTAHLVLFGNLKEEKQGNILLDSILGAKIHLIDASTYEQAYIEAQALANELNTLGQNVYLIDLLGETALISFPAYLLTAKELIDQLEANKINADWLILPSGSGATQASITSGLKLLESQIKVLGVSIRKTKDRLRKSIMSDIRSAEKRFGFGLSLDAEDIRLTDKYLGEGFEKLDSKVLEAIQIVARTEGILLDPVYSGKAMSGLISEIRAGSFGPEETVIFLHTGGLPALFAYNREINANLT